MAKLGGNKGGNGGSKGGNSSNDIMKQLAAAKERWNKSKEEAKKPGGQGGTSLEDGPYITRLSNAEIKGSSKGPGLVLEFTVIEGEDQAGETASRWAGWDTDERMVYMMRDLNRLGVDTDEFEITDLPKICEGLIEEAPTVRVAIKTNGEYKNVYIDKLVNTDDGSGEAADSGGDEPDAGEGENQGDDEGVDNEETIDIGSKVRYTIKGKKFSGVVKKIDEDAGTADIMNDKTKKLDKGVSGDDIEALAEVE